LIADGGSDSPWPILEDNAYRRLPPFLAVLKERETRLGYWAKRYYVPSDMETETVTAARGRPREFDIEEALAAALRVFWEKGYEGASLTDLTDAMGITRPSLYAAFGNKEALFKRALDLYEAEKLAYVRRSLDAPTARGVAQRLLEGAIETVTGECPGCLGVIVSVSCGGTESPIQQDLRARAQSSKAALAERMQRAIGEGDFTLPVTADAMTQYVLAVLQGLAVQAGTGATREQLQQVANATLAIWPSR
jgi:AcrR family transcriptional regulator